MNQPTVTKDPEAKSLTIEYVLHAPVELVWKAYADQDWFEQWWGPQGWQTTTRQFDLKPGGRIHYGMECIDPNQTEWYGQVSWGVMDIQAVDEQRSITALDYFSDADGNTNPDMPSQTFSIELVEDNGATRLISRSLMTSTDQLEQLVNMGMVKGFTSQLHKLEKLLADHQS